MRETTAPGGPTRRHLVLAALLVLVGLFVLAHTVVATSVSVLLIGWSALAAGSLALLLAMKRVGRRSFWFSAFSGALSATLGVVILRNPQAAAETLTLIAGALFLALGALRLITPADDRRSRALLVGTGGAYVALGIFVLSDVAAASVVLLGRVVGLQILLDGLSLLLVGRLRDPRRRRASTPAPPPVLTTPPSSGPGRTRSVETNQSRRVS